MTLDARLEAHAEALRRAAATGKPVAPLTDVDPDLTVADAYAIQLANVEHRLASGRRIVGHKVGLTSRAMQEMLGVDEPDFGALTDDMLVEDGATLDLREMVHPRIEAEIGLILRDDLRGPGVTTVQALSAIGWAIPALEIIDTRIEDWRIQLADTIADNGSCGKFVLGSQRTPVDGLDLRLVGMAFSRNGTVIDAGAGAAALGHPARCVAWLANKLAEFDVGLEAGEMLLPGALHRAYDAEPGTVFLAEYSQLGRVSVEFVDSGTGAR
jgi:2-keto-4-pentenoate hydratase